ncbi:ATP-binding cassette domain-containing protein [Lachnoclostridium phytofermentans]|uniref:ABC-type sugar transport system ATPase component-like protein n=1 Tax=Lachnoclostridium phytofermentans (strain ATCC 700394 / DSM 18823 / ISDg) TaxID=357809 RepID=A9KSI2_LACP7|nr:ATP-binding cassette domain-containing protein [Lachnoclostridium phytofermentans]ABX43634.1 ABC-type sugar transport system ATPase component-like protein [Lachnoclostridium phytofermentans ISDg]
MRKEILRMENVTKSYAGVIYLDNFNMQIYKGEIMGLIPINRQGKSELIELLCQNSPIDYGRIYLNNELVNYYEHSSNSVNRVYVIDQKSKLIQDLTVSDNIFVLRRGFKKYMINNKVLRVQVNKYLKEIGVYINPDELITNLNPFEQCVVELVKAIITGANLIIISDITDILSVVDISKLYQLVNFYSDKGYTFLFIGSHHEEMFTICNRVSLMKDGGVIKVLDKQDMRNDLINLFTISFADNKQKIDRYNGQGILEFENICTDNLNKMSFSIKKGECVVLFDTNNTIYSDLLDLINGDLIPTCGRILYNNQVYSESVARKALENGIAVISEGSIQKMIFYNLSYVDNLCFLIDKKIDKKIMSRNIKKSIIKEYESILGEEIHENDLLNLEPASLYNLVYYRLHLYNPNIVFCIQPFSGADMYLRKHIADLIRELKRKGITIIIIAVNISDTLSVADRLMIIEKGSVLKEYSKDEFDSIHVIA